MGTQQQPVSVALQHAEQHPQSADRPMYNLPSTALLGVRLHAITERQCVEIILHRLHEGYGGWVVTPNLDILRRCDTNSRFAELVAKADLVVADGMPLVWASRLKRTPLPERVAGSTLISTLSSAAAEHGRSIFLLGGEPGAAAGAASVLKQRHSGLVIAGTHCPPIGFENSPMEMARIKSAIVGSQPDIVFVGLGSPKQENLIVRLRALSPRSWWLGVGVSFSFLSGRIRRAPLWMQRIGLEWTHRLAQEPNRLAHRYMVAGLPFAGRLLLRALCERFVGAGTSKR